MTKIVTSLVLAASVLAGIGAAQAAPKINGDFATTFFAEQARNGN
jgi:hypothetical protein